MLFSLVWWLQWWFDGMMMYVCLFVFHENKNGESEEKNTLAIFIFKWTVSNVELSTTIIGRQVSRRKMMIIMMLMINHPVKQHVYAARTMAKLNSPDIEKSKYFFKIILANLLRPVRWKRSSRDLYFVFGFDFLVVLVDGWLVVQVGWA